MKNNSNPTIIPEGNWAKCKLNDQIRFVTRHTDKNCFEDDGTISKLSPSDRCYYENYEIFYPNKTMTHTESILQRKVLWAEIKTLQREFKQNQGLMEIINENQKKLGEQLRDKLDKIQELAEERDNIPHLYQNK